MEMAGRITEKPVQPGIHSNGRDMQPVAYRVTGATRVSATTEKHKGGSRCGVCPVEKAHSRHREQEAQRSRTHEGTQRVKFHKLTEVARTSWKGLPDQQYHLCVQHPLILKGTVSRVTCTTTCNGSTLGSAEKLMSGRSQSYKVAKPAFRTTKPAYFSTEDPLPTTNTAEIYMKHCALFGRNALT